MSKVAELLHSSYSGIELSIDELANYFNIEEDSALDRLVKCNEKLEQFGLSVDPPLKKGSFNEKRLVFIKDSNPEYNLKKDLLRDEGIELEFKSSLLFDIKQAKHRPEVSPSKLDSKAVIHSVLKTICAFLNAGGGILYIGITDDKEIFGLEKDFLCLQVEDFDKWELHLRSLITGRFYQGKDILKYCRVDKVEIEEKIVVKVDVKTREKETFYRKEGNSVYAFYIRNGNRTDSIPIERLPEYIRYNEDK